MRTSVWLVLLLLLGLVSTGPAAAQGLNIDIVNGTKSAIPVAVVPFANETAGPPPATDVSDVVRMDLARSGRFRALDRSDVVEFPSRGSEIKFPTWRLLKQDYIVVGHVENAGSQYKIGFELWNVATQQSMLSLSYTAPAADLRGIAHQIADQVFEKITGLRGAFFTRIAYVTSVGSGHDIQYSLIVADSDGYNPQVVVRSREALLSPSWSPDGKELAYVSFESGNSAVYVQNIATGARRLVSAHKRGINGAPAFSPDGSKLAVSLSYVGNPEIFVIDLASHKETRLTHSFAIDTEPEWMPDGQSLVFTSDRAGKPQLYQVPASGGTPQRLTFQGQYNANASISFDGKQIAMVQGNGNVYRIAIMDRSLGGQVRFVSPGNFDEAPSFAPNGSMLLYAASEGLRGVLYAVSADGKVRQRLVLSDGDVREPAWGPYRQP